MSERLQMHAQQVVVLCMHVRDHAYVSAYTFLCDSPVQLAIRSNSKDAYYFPPLLLPNLISVYLLWDPGGESGQHRCYWKCCFVCAIGHILPNLNTTTSLNTAAAE